MKKLLTLLLFLPAVSFADRLGSLRSNSDVLLSTQSTSSAYSRSGYSSRFGQAYTLATSSEALDAVFLFTYQSPTVTLSSTYTVRTEEFGTSVSSIQWTATTVETSSPILTVQFKQGSTLLYNYPNPTQTGGTQIWVDTTPVTTTASFNAYAGDGTSTGTSNTVTFTFVYPYYYGVGAQNLTFAQVQALTKLVQTHQTTTTTTSPNNQVYYFAYPQSYGVLTSILDQNGFETISGYTRRSGTMTMLDLTVQNYYVYEFNSLTTQTNFQNTYQ